MIKEILLPIYTFICDGCGKDSNEDCEYSGWDDEAYAWDCAEEDDWIEFMDEHYCHNCYGYDEDGEIILKPKEVTNYDSKTKN
jgi:hypothetical protein